MPEAASPNLNWRALALVSLATCTLTAASIFLLLDSRHFRSSCRKSKRHRFSSESSDEDEDNMPGPVVYLNNPNACLDYAVGAGVPMSSTTPNTSSGRSAPTVKISWAASLTAFIASCGGQGARSAGLQCLCVCTAITRRSSSTAALRTWLKSVLPSNHNHDGKDLIDDLDTDEITKQAVAFASDVVFSHNDLLSGNILHNPDWDRVQIIDYEYGGYNYRGFDFANHFCENCGFELDLALYPSIEKQFAFFKAYMSTAAPKMLAQLEANRESKHSSTRSKRFNAFDVHREFFVGSS
ncbi:Protein kinase-like domain [Phytophthora cactorum]|nr:Protein kinase-like domain [Phytophthora cactorum]